METHILKSIKNGNLNYLLSTYPGVNFSEIEYIYKSIKNIQKVDMNSFINVYKNVCGFDEYMYNFITNRVYISNAVFEESKPRFSFDEMI